MLHIFFHFSLPALLALAGFIGVDRKLGCQRFAQYYLLMIATMAVDIDHLVAQPIYAPLRCSLGFHPLHQTEFIIIYALLSLLVLQPRQNLRFIGWAGVGLSLHMLLDGLDCYSHSGIFFHAT